MRRNFLTGLLICLIPTLLAGLAVGLAFQRESRGVAGFRRGIDLAGGSILVYEVDLERSLRQKDTTATREGLSNEEIRRLADNIKRRIDPNDLFNVVVRPVGTTRVEVIIPFSGTAADQGKEVATADTVQQVKETLRQVGLLEFRIVANTTDDADGIADTRTLLGRAATDPKVKSDLEELAQRGLPPLASATNYTVTVNGEAQDNVSYEWVPLGKEERESYGLSNAYATEAPPKKPGIAGSTWFYPEMEQARNANGGAMAKAGAVVAIGRNLFFTREYSRVKGPPSEADMRVEYFLLTRLSPSDAVRVDREMGLVARAGEGRNGGPAVDFSFNPNGAERFGRITARNVADPATKFERQLAIVMDGRIISAPNLSAGQAPIRDSGQISGNFTQAAVNRLVFLLRSGALNAELKSEPVSENSILPTLGQDTISKGLTAVGFSFLAVLAFMIVYYRFAGIVACIALFVNLLLTVGFMVAVQAAFTLPGLAGIVLMLGMAVDANVLIYERIREEREKGATLGNAIRLGIRPGVRHDYRHAPDEYLHLYRAVRVRQRQPQRL